MATSAVEQVSCVEDAADEAAGDDRTRRCGRCQGEFRLADDAVSIPDWWVCQPCRATLIPGSVR